MFSFIRDEKEFQAGEHQGHRDLKVHGKLADVEGDWSLGHKQKGRGQQETRAMVL